jgi:hypothetical protein
MPNRDRDAGRRRRRMTWPAWRRAERPEAMREVGMWLWPALARTTVPTLHDPRCTEPVSMY